jgi:hypothetical protein
MYMVISLPQVPDLPCFSLGLIQEMVGKTGPTVLALGRTAAALP